MVIFRENTEDIYAGIEFEHGSEDNKKFKELFKAGVPEGVRQDPLPGHLRHRLQARVAGRHRAPVQGGAGVRDRATSAAA